MAIWARSYNDECMFFLFFVFTFWLVEEVPKPVLPPKHQRGTVDVISLEVSGSLQPCSSTYAFPERVADGFLQIYLS